jgi:hypothetical protein
LSTFLQAFGAVIDTDEALPLIQEGAGRDAGVVFCIFFGALISGSASWGWSVDFSNIPS